MSEIALLFLIYDNLTHYDRFKPLIESCNTYIHVKDPAKTTQDIQKYFIPNTVETTLGDYSIVAATIELLKSSYREPDNKWFILLSHDTYPIVNSAADLEQSISSHSNTSSIFQLIGRSKINDDKFVWKTRQWWILFREDVEIILRNYEEFNKLFKDQYKTFLDTKINISAPPDEIYFLTLLKYYKPAYVFKDATVMYTKWLKHVVQKHPTVFNKLLSTDANEIQKVRPLFIRKTLDSFQNTVVQFKRNVYVFYIGPNTVQDTKYTDYINDETASIILITSIPLEQVNDQLLKNSIQIFSIDLEFYYECVLNLLDILPIRECESIYFVGDEFDMSKLTTNFDTRQRKVKLPKPNMEFTNKGNFINDDQFYVIADTQGGKTFIKSKKQSFMIEEPEEKLVPLPLVPTKNKLQLLFQKPVVKPFNKLDNILKNGEIAFDTLEQEGEFSINLLKDRINKVYLPLPPATPEASSSGVEETKQAVKEEVFVTEDLDLGAKDLGAKDLGAEDLNLGADETGFDAPIIAAPILARPRIEPIVGVEEADNGVEETKELVGKTMKVKRNVNKTTKKNQKGIARLDERQYIEIGDTPFDERLPKNEIVRMKASSYYMNNRKMFIQLTNNMFKGYQKDLLDETKNITCDSMRGDNSFSLLTHQKIVRDYMNLYTPYRGLLLYHGLGSGKTCSSIAIAESLKSNKKIIIMTPASLHSNYLEEIKKCGDIYYKKYQYWEWIPVINNQSLLETISTVLNLPMEFIVQNQGAWVINVSKQASNYDELKKSAEDPVENIGKNQFVLNKQLDMMISQKYEFIHYNGLRSDTYDSKYRKNGNYFDNAVVIIDEAHNLISRIVNQISILANSGKQVNATTRSSKVNPLSIRIYKDLINAENSKIVLLTGTPIINYPNEIGILFNILRGAIKMYTFKLETSSSLNIDLLKDIFRDNNNLDYMDFKPRDNLFMITRNPFGFQNTASPYKGVTASRTPPLSEKDFISYIIDILKTRDIRVNVSKTNPKIDTFTALPDTLDEFNQEFINSELTTVQAPRAPGVAAAAPGVVTSEYSFKNTLKFKYRIMGLTSYFRSAQEELLPRYDKTKNLHVIHIPMSDSQFDKYEIYRQEERKSEKEKKTKKGKKPGDPLTEFKSTFKIFSRMACNFVSPGGLIRPRPSAIIDTEKACAENDVCSEEPPAVDETNEAVLQNTDFRIADELEGDELLGKDARYKEQLQQYISSITQDAARYLSKSGLQDCSPKFLSMLENIENPEHVGLHLIYSQFRTVEGIELFSAALNQNGFIRFKIKYTGGVWGLDFNVAELSSKSTYALYTGLESSDEREILRNIYNGNWKNVPKSLSDVLKPISETNNMGQLIKVLMITAAGSEGINLLNTRYVHVMEPYWHPVRMEQVIGRARRICSHQSLPVELQTVDVFLYLMEFTKKQLDSPQARELIKHDLGKINNKQVFTSDQSLYEISCIKEKLIFQLLKAVKEASIDCITHIKSSANEKLTCLSFGNLSSTNMDFSYNPDIKMDQNDDTIKQNMVTTNFGDFKIIVDEDTENRYVLNTETNQLYSEDSYERAKSSGDPNYLVVVGNIVDGSIRLI
jgi:hypothetical protein